MIVQHIELYFPCRIFPALMNFCLKPFRIPQSASKWLLQLGISACLLAAGVQPLRADSRIDSLLAVQLRQLESGDQAGLTKTHLALGEAYRNEQIFDSAMFYFRQCLAGAGSEIPEYRYRALVELGKIENYPRNQPIKAISYLQQAEAITGPWLTPIDKRLLSYELGNAFLAAHNYEQAMSYHFKGARMAEDARDTIMWWSSLWSLGSVYWEIDQFANSLSYYRKAYELRKTSPGSYFTALSSIAIAHLSMHTLDSALYYTRLARKDAKAFGEEYGEPYCLGLLGNIKMEMGLYREAIDSLEASVSLCEELGYVRDAMSYRIDLGKAYALNKDFSKALAALNLAEEEAKKMDQLGLLRSNYEIRSQVHAWQGDSSLAFVYLKKYYQIRDSLLDEEVMTGLASLERGFEIDKREETIQEQAAQIEASRRMLYIYGFASGIVFLLVVLYMAYVRNKTLRQVNQLLEVKNAEIRRQNDRLASSNEDLRQFAHVTSHDLREPLRNISSFASLLARRYKDKLDSVAEEYLFFITDGAKRMDRLLNDLLTYSVVGVFDHEYTQVDISKTISDVMRRFQQNKSLHGAKIRMHKLPVIRANAAQMEQLFTQIIDNALKFRSSDPPEIDVRASEQEDGYIFSVQDNGIGMDKVYQDKIFALFLRLHNQQSAYEGSGIGLSIVKKIVEQHEGRIWIESEPGKGTTVFFFLPKDPPYDPTPTHIRDRWQWLQPIIPAELEEEKSQ